MENYIYRFIGFWNTILEYCKIMSEYLDEMCKPIIDGKYLLLAGKPSSLSDKLKPDSVFDMQAMFFYVDDEGRVIYDHFPWTKAVYADPRSIRGPSRFLIELSDFVKYEFVDTKIFRLLPDIFNKFREF